MPFAYLCAEIGKAIGTVRHYGHSGQGPQGLSTSGCGYAIMLHKRFDEAVMILRKNNLLNGKLFGRDGNGEYKEVRA